MLLPAIPNLVHDFKIAYNTSSWILTAYLITGAVKTPIVGKLSDTHRKKKVLMIIMVIYSIGTLLGGISTNINSYGSFKDNLGNWYRNVSRSF